MAQSKALINYDPLSKEVAFEIKNIDVDFQREFDYRALELFK